MLKVKCVLAFKCNFNNVHRPRSLKFAICKKRKKKNQKFNQNATHFYFEDQNFKNKNINLGI